jgi:Methyltransferase domain
MIFHYSCLAFSLLTMVNLSAKTLDELAIQYGTDKSSYHHAYTKYYEKYFELMRDKPVKFLEIGFYRGASAHMWEDYFSNGDLFFIDINPHVFTQLNEFKRVHINLVNQDDVCALNNFIEEVGTGFDIIIDDGGHTMSQQITSFKTLFPHVKSGGIYVIEDLHTSYPYGPNYAFDYGCANPEQPTAVNFLKTLVDCVNLPGARTTCADARKCPRNLISDLSSYVSEIESIHFYCSLVFIIKK